MLGFVLIFWQNDLFHLELLSCIVGLLGNWKMSGILGCGLQSTIESDIDVLI